MIENQDAIQWIRHIVGNHIIEGRLFHAGKSHRDVAEVRKIQGVATERLEKALKEKQIADPGALEILEALKNSDWGDRSSYEAFRERYDQYVAPVEKEVTREINELFGKR